MQARTQITQEFFYKYESEIPHLVWFQDPVGTCFVTMGFSNMECGEFWNTITSQKGCGWSYDLTGTILFMTTQNLKGHKIPYPQPAITYPHDMEKIEEGSSSEAPFVSPRDWSSFHQYHFKLSLFEITTESLVMLTFVI